MASPNRDEVFDDSSEQGATFNRTSSASGTGSTLFQDVDNLPDPSAGQGGAAAALDSASTSTKSTGSYRISYTPCGESLSSLPPRASAPREPGNTLSLASDLNDPIPVRFAQQAASGAPRASTIRQIAPSDSSSSSAEETGPEETDSGRTELGSQLRCAVGTPATSDASEDADILDLAQAPYGHPTGAANRDLSLAGLDLLEEYRDRPFHSDLNDESGVDIIDNINETLTAHTRLQASHDAIPWNLGGEDGRLNNPDDRVLAPFPGPAYVEYHLPMRKYIQRYYKIQRLQEWQTIPWSCEAQPTPLESCDEPAIGTPDCQWDISSRVSTEWPRGEQSQDYQDIHIERLSGTVQQPIIPRSVDCVSYSLETLVSIFHPTFLVSHLSRDSVLTLTTELYAPKGLAYESEHALAFDLGFGPPIHLDVCPFTPRDKKALRSYQKHEGKDTLVVQESLPIAINLFSPESHAEELDLWLDGILNSESWLLEYVALMILREKDSHFSHALKALISWYMASMDRLSEQEDQILRPALKLLITTTLLSLVPEVSDLPASLFDYLSSQTPAQDTTHLSLVAPRLLTRQTKASLYYLQEHFLHTIFCHFSYPMQLDADVQIALAFLVAYVLDLVRNAGRGFANYAMAFNSTFPVTSRHVTEYERNVETQLFEKVWWSVAGGNGWVGELAERWRNLDSSIKGKENESDEHQFACAILDVVL